ncbi:MAG: hypothetical protein OXH65_10730 [Paracoccaceae bacterium]|nr:hypothetical protein [Paracoccaceae bacterium]MDE2675571.1 hypothetical protein [Paracoccaceae bacterium]MDE2738639.1 hypothetical protein [Paracoccaceae bacterium]MXZ51060.1 hypothetical protein [Paracoccaceae bacterium]MYF46155.1 hypothetical protein [Paracoccaceae bacterium]
MKQKEKPYIPLTSRILITLFLIVCLVSLVGYISAREVPEMPKWPDYFHGNFLDNQDQEDKDQIKEQNENWLANKNSKATNGCPEGDCETKEIPSLIAEERIQGYKENVLGVDAPIHIETPIPDEEAEEQDILVEADEVEVDHFSEDPLTREQEKVIIATGLLSRHAEITESIYLMEQQLKQAQLIIELMEILGPDVPIEISPGKFKNFSDTPAGKRIASEMAIAALKGRADLFDLEMKVITAGQKIENALKPQAEIVEIEDNQQTKARETKPVPEPRLREIIGGEGNLQAIFSLDDEIVSLKEGEKLPTGEEIIQITQEFVELSKFGQRVILSIK